MQLSGLRDVLVRAAQVTIVVDAKSKCCYRLHMTVLIYYTLALKSCI